MKKYLLLIIFALSLTLVSCTPKYSKNAYYEAEKIEKTKSKVNLGSTYSDLEINDDFKNAVINFSYKTASDLLEDRNGMISPLSYFYALSALAEITETDTRSEVLSALLIDDIETLRKGNLDLYKKLNYENEISMLSLSNSIWLNNNYEYKEEPLQKLKDYYYASSYGVDFTNSDDKSIIGKWVADRTGGKLGRGDFDDLDPLTVVVLLNVIYFFDKWDSEFEKKDNVEMEFKGLKDSVTYMTQTTAGVFKETDSYEASFLKFKNGMQISFVKPSDNNVLVEILSNPESLKEALEISGFSQSVKYFIPKFSYKTSFGLVDYTKQIGINRAFSFDESDWTGLIDTIRLRVSDVFQKTFIEIDEEGGRAAAYTGIVGDKESAMPDFKTFKLDGPFIYAIYSGEYPLFIGVVKNPNSSLEEKY